MKEKKENKATSKPLSRENARVRYRELSEKDEKKKHPSKESFQDIAEAKIRQAMANGEFNNLKGKGKPIDLNKYYGMPGHLRLGYQLLKNAGYIPEEVRLKKEMEVIKDKIRNTGSENRNPQTARWVLGNATSRSTCSGLILRKNSIRRASIMPNPAGWIMAAARASGRAPPSRLSM